VSCVCMRVCAAPAHSCKRWQGHCAHSACVCSADTLVREMTYDVYMRMCVRVCVYVCVCSAATLVREMTGPLCAQLYSSREALSQRSPALAVEASRLLLLLLRGAPEHVRPHALAGVCVCVFLFVWTCIYLCICIFVYVCVCVSIW